MTPLERCLRRARLRLFVQRTVRCWGWLSLAALGVGVALLLADRLLALAVPWWSYAIVAGLALLAGPILAWIRLPETTATAALLDARLGLKDRLSTALFAHRLGDDPMARQVIDEAQQTAGELSLRQALPLKPGKAWGWVAPAAGVMAVLAVFLPGNVDLLGLHQAAKREQTRAQQTAAAKKNLVQATRLIEQVEHKPDAQQADPDKIMKELAALSQRDLRSPEMTKAAMAKLTEAQKQLDKAKQAKSKQLQTVRNAMSQLETAQHGPADRFADALRRGDFAAAQRELQALAQQIQNGKMSGARKQALQHQLQQMAKQLQQQARQAQQQGQAAQQKIQQTLSNAGVGQQQIQQLQKQGYSPQAVQQALQQNGMSQQQAQQLAKQLQQQQQQSGQGSPSQQANQGLSQAMQQMAQGLGPQGQGQQGRPQQQGQQGKQNQQGQQGKGNQQGQQGGQSQFAQGAWRGQQQLSQLARMQQQLQQMGVAQSRMQQAMQQLAGGPGSSAGMMHQQGQQGGGGAMASRRPGTGAGTGSGGNPLGPTQQHLGPYKTRNQGDITPGRRGRVIASWLQNGPMTAGAPTVRFDQAVTQARDQAEQAVTENGVPQRYHQAIHDYFNQLPQTAAQARQQAPAAPR